MNKGSMEQTHPNEKVLMNTNGGLPAWYVHVFPRPQLVDLMRRYMHVRLARGLSSVLHRHLPFPLSLTYAGILPILCRRSILSCRIRPSAAILFLRAAHCSTTPRLACVSFACYPQSLQCPHGLYLRTYAHFLTHTIHLPGFPTRKVSPPARWTRGCRFGKRICNRGASRTRSRGTRACCCRGKTRPTRRPRPWRIPRRASAAEPDDNWFGMCCAALACCKSAGPTPRTTNTVSDLRLQYTGPRN